MSNAAAADGADGLVNATPLGMHNHPGTPIDSRLIGAQHWAFDAVYTPRHTEFLLAAERAGLHIVWGFDLFLYQAVDAFEVFTGHRLDPNQIETIAAICRADTA